MKKRFVSLMMACTMVVSLAACGGNSGGNTNPTTTPAPSQQTTTKAPDTTPAPDNKGGSGDAVTLKWAIWDQDTTPYWVALKDGYEATHNNVTIELVDLGSTDYMTVLATQLSGSTSAFDVVSVKDVPGYATLVQKNTIEPLDSYIKADNIDLSLYGGATDQITVNGSLYQLPFRNDFWVLFYNKDLFDAKNLAYPTNDMTFEEYDA